MISEQFFSRFDMLTATHDAAQKLRDLVLHLAVRGQLSKSHPDDEPVGNFLDRVWNDPRDPRTQLPEGERKAPFPIPDHWRWVALAEIVEFMIGKTPARNDPRYWDSEDHNWVSIADMVHYGTVTDTKERVSDLALREIFRNRKAPSGSILMSFKLTIGKVARAGIDCFHNEAIISLKPPEPQLLEYLFRFLPVFALLQTSNNAIKGSTLNKTLLTEMPIALPPLAEQDRIVARVNDLLLLVDRLEADFALARVTGEKLMDAAIAELTAAE